MRDRFCDSDRATQGGRWSLVLAGGEGERMRSAIEGWLGAPRPKQYCAFTGGRTMLEHTWDRALGFAGPGRVVTVLGPAHGRYLRDGLGEGEGPLCCLEQPSNKGTALGVYLGLLQVMRRDPAATVLLLPADHWIRPFDLFQRQVRAAAGLAESRPDWMVLLGAVPEGPDEDYGWIAPGEPVAWSNGKLVRRVRAFHEKPSAGQACEYYAHGGLWNTMIMACKAATLWRLGWNLLPDMMRVLEALGHNWDSPRRRSALDAAYQSVKPACFSRDIVQAASQECAVVMPMTGLAWSDWGRPERITRTLRVMGKDVPFREAEVNALV